MRNIEPAAKYEAPTKEIVFGETDQKLESIKARLGLLGVLHSYFLADIKPESSEEVSNYADSQTGYTHNNFILYQLWVGVATNQITEEDVEYFTGKNLSELQFLSLTDPDSFFRIFYQADSTADGD